VKARQAVTLTALAVVAAASIEAFAQGKPATPAAAAAKPAVATVGTRSIARDEWERRCSLALAEFARRNGAAEVPPELRDLVRRQVLESQIRIELLVLEAKRTGVTASPAEAEAVLKQDPFFSPNGQFDQARWTAVKTQQAANFNIAIASAQEQIAARKLNAQVEAKVRPNEDSLRAAVSRAMSRASLEHLSLRRNDFEGTYSEPRESDVVEWYTAHRADFQRPDRASLTVTFVNSPGLSDSIRALPNGAENWTRRMKAVADSILAQVRGGATLEAAAGFLGPRPNSVVTSDNFPGYWRAGDDVNRQLFDPRNKGKVIPQALPAAEGWLVVRVDEILPAHVAPMREVAREIRGLLRRDRRTNHEEYELRSLYGRVRDSLAAPGWRFRVAVSDSADLKIPPPSAGDLDRYYRGHLADYSAFDAKTGAIVSKPLPEVRDDVQARWYAERRRTETRLNAETLLRTWRSGKRDAKLETALRTRDLEPLVKGSRLDPDPGAKALSDSVWSYPDPKGPGMVAIGRGWAVWQATGKADHAVPSFEQARPLLETRLAGEKAAEEERGARKLFDDNAARFASGDLVYFSRFPVTPAEAMTIPLTRAEVEKYHRDHIEQYSAPELVTARHILVAVANNTPEADRAARARADDLLKRVRDGGEQFSKLAKENSDDPATREKGGDLGTFGRGTMVDAFERAVFALPVGEFAPQPVRTPLGWHVIQCTDHTPAVVHNLDWIYTVVGSNAAREKSMRLASARADSFVRVLKNGREAKALAARMGYQIQSLPKRIGETSQNAALAEYFRRLDNAKPGQMVMGVDNMPGTDYWVTWVDSIAPAGRPTWEVARPAAIEAYRRGAGKRSLDAKVAELDSLLSSGWSLDSVAALWGGLETLPDAQVSRGLPNLGGGPQLDSLVTGTPGHKALQPGQESRWVEFPNGWARIRLVSRSDPPHEAVLARMENERSAATERGLIAYFDRLKKRWPVRILDQKMRDVIPAQPAPPGGR
jgi:parvulin-like peptidyl-prolyl isomerase